MPPHDALEAIFDADRRLQETERALFASTAAAELPALLAAAVEEAAALSDRSEASMRLERLADLCAQVPGPRMADTLIAILGDDDPAVRVAAGEALLDVGYERYAEVAHAIERALDAPLHGLAMSELPWVLAEIGEPSALPLIKRFLAHADAETVAAAIEALAELGDPAAIPALEPLVDDERTVPVADLDDETTATIGELAEDAIDELAPDGHDEPDRPDR